LWNYTYGKLEKSLRDGQKIGVNRDTRPINNDGNGVGSKYKRPKPVVN